MIDLIKKIVLLTGLGTAGLLGIALLVLIIGVFLLTTYALGGLIIWAAWNLVVPAFGGPHMSFWVGLGISILIFVIKGILN